MNLRIFNPLLWGFSIALSWTWGLGLFFSVQMAIQFGLAGLLLMAVPNAIGLTAFGWFAHHIAGKCETSLEFEKRFLRTVGELRWIFLFYQVLAIALTFFALLKYVFIPLDVNYGLILLLVLGLALLLGEQFNIRHLKWTHLGFAAVIVLSVLLIGWGGGSYFNAADVIPRDIRGEEGVFFDPVTGDFKINWYFLGFFIPIVVGFTLGPWLDIQQWQRAIQIRREKSNIRASYIFGGLTFFGILLFHGTLALAIWGEGRRLGILNLMSEPGRDGLLHVKDAVVRFLFLSDVQNIPLIFQVMYVIFLCLCIIATLDSGYVALKWFQTDAVKKTDSIFVSLVPKSFLESPIPPFLLAALVGLAGIWTGLELEYYMAFYGSFLVGYALVFLFRVTFEPRFAAFTQTTLVSLASISIAVFGIGYLTKIWPLMALGSLIPLAHAIVCIATRKAVAEIQKTGMMERLAEGDVAGAVKTLRRQDSSADDLKKVEGAADEKKESGAEVKAADVGPAAPDDAERVDSGGSTWFEGKTFVHKIVPTYQDTNSVGNIYFAQYGMFVGKTRELFFNHVLPDFDLKTTRWYVLTRSYEHKFVNETHEFEPITVRLRISEVSRKFCTIEHQIHDSSKKLLGKGKQMLLFVSSEDYRLIDIPPDVLRAFMPYV